MLSDFGLIGKRRAVPHQVLAMTLNTLTHRYALVLVSKQLEPEAPTSAFYIRPVVDRILIGYCVANQFFAQVAVVFAVPALSTFAE